MVLAVAVTAIKVATTGGRFELIIIGIAIGAAIGGVLAVKIKMEAMPQLVALFNGFGGGASVFFGLGFFNWWKRIDKFFHFIIKFIAHECHD